MKLLLCVLALLAVAFGDTFRSASMVRRINMARTTWKAGVNERFEGMSQSAIRRQMGVLMDEEKRLHKTLPVQSYNNMNNDIPESFDSREAWPECADVINNIRDQSACGSCWAVAAAGAMSDRICIASKGANKVSISGADLMECCFSCGYGCEGGYPSAAWRWFKNTGLVSGGNYTSKQGCKPYPLANCEHHNSHTTFKPCPSTLYDTPKCKHECQDGYETSYGDDKFNSKTSYSVRSDVKDIQMEIMTNGPVEASYTVYEDFLAYKSGVYQHKSGGYDGGHAVRMIGWGVENGTPYWLIANSWNSDWGDKGFFKILRGNDECGIESGITAGKVM